VIIDYGRNNLIEIEREYIHDADTYIECKLVHVADFINDYFHDITIADLASVDEPIEEYESFSYRLIHDGIIKHNYEASAKLKSRYELLYKDNDCREYNERLSNEISRSKIRLNYYFDDDRKYTGCCYICNEPLINDYVVQGIIATKCPISELISADQFHMNCFDNQCVIPDNSDSKRKRTNITEKLQNVMKARMKNHDTTRLDVGVNDDTDYDTTRMDVDINDDDDSDWESGDIIIITSLTNSFHYQQMIVVIFVSVGSSIQRVQCLVLFMVNTFIDHVMRLYM
jgi:hypothetical protein